MKSAIEIAWCTPNATAKPLATIASRNASDIDSATADARFWPTSVSMRHESRNVPAWTAVPSRLPSAPKTLPRMPIAAGTRIMRPGSFSRVPVIEPSVRPGDEAVARRDQERDEARTDPGEVRTHERAEARTDAVREERHWVLGGSFWHLDSGRQRVHRNELPIG